MYILQTDNTAFCMDNLPNQVDDMRYCVLDYSNQADVDFYYIPLVFLDVFPRPAADLKIGPYRIRMPLDWSIVIADKNFGLVEILELKHLNDREFSAFALNPMKSYMPSFFEITIENVFPDATWHMPRLKYGHILAVPLHDGPDPLCAFFLRDTNKIPESLDITKIFT
ncbi:MAG: hypothetical protein EOP83_05700 [Verrucomicrobiaceae bacterium]|nr:MAG: hypothetical protein EOP83_05700 [Verrucomicrobiaceae bacterium]